MAGSYTEDQLVEQPAIQLLADLGWQSISAMEEVFGASEALGRETSGEGCNVFEHVYDSRDGDSAYTEAA
jgi:hypothetical protein